MTGKKLGRYDLIRVLGKGAMGLVYEGRDPNLDRRVAIKTIKVENLSEEAAIEYEARFRTEARSAARLQHPNIVSVYDSDRDGDIAFLVMEFIQGDDLKHHLDQGKRHTLEQTLAVMGDLLSALDYAHRAKIVHRDIKPANLLIEASGRVKLTDFGVARIQDSGDATRTQGSMVGTLKYMSPEQVQGLPVDARSDLFAAGVVLYQLLTGKRPFDGDSDFAIIQRIVAQDAAPPSSINPLLPPAIDAVVARALAKSRDQRFATAQEFDAALQACAGQAADPKVIAPATTPAESKTTTWSGTVRAGESLVDTQSGLGTGTGTGTGTGGSVVTQELELVYWKDIKDTNDAEDLQGFLARFPLGIYADLARRRLRKLGAPAGDDPSSGSRSGTGSGTSIPVGSALAQDKTQLIPNTAVGATGLVPPAGTGRVDSAWDALDAAGGSDEPTRMTSAVHGAAPGTAAQENPAPSAHASEPSPEPSPELSPAPRRGAWVLAGIVALVGVGLGFKLLPGPAVPAQGGASAAASAAVPGSAAAGASATAAMPAATSASAPLQVGQATSAQPVTSAASAASAAAAGASAAASALARKAAADKDRLARQAGAKAPVPTPLAEPAHTGPAALQPAAAAQNARAAPSAHPEAGPAPLASGNPRQACEDRTFISFQNCMAEQCAKPVFTNHAVCVERRAMEQRRREAEQQRR